MRRKRCNAHQYGFGNAYELLHKNKAKRKVVGKGGAYECGMEPVGTARLRLSIHFYLTAVLFILFDVEGIFLMLWSTAAKSFQAAGAGALVFTEILVFVAMLVVALVFVWRKGGLEWDR